MFQCSGSRWYSINYADTISTFKVIVSLTFELLTLNNNRVALFIKINHPLHLGESWMVMQSLSRNCFNIQCNCKIDFWRVELINKRVFFPIHYRKLSFLRMKATCPTVLESLKKNEVWQTYQKNSEGKTKTFTYLDIFKQIIPFLWLFSGMTRIIFAKANNHI